MCGIFCYLGKKNATAEIMLGLKRLQYRGYDSWGVAVCKNCKIHTERRVGPLTEQQELNLPAGTIGLGHTRWATHGEVSVENAHPITASSGAFTVVHNGMVENCQHLKQDLIDSGYCFKTETDTEVIAALIERQLRLIKKEPVLANDLYGGDLLLKAVAKTFAELEGRNAVVILDKVRMRTIAVRAGSPLVLGLAADEIFLASDVLAFAHRTNSAILIEDRQMVVCSNKGSVQVWDLAGNRQAVPQIQEVNLQAAEVELGEHPHYMLKEIMEQRNSVFTGGSLNQEQLGKLAHAVKDSQTVFTVGAGAAFFAAQQIAYFLRSIADMKAYAVAAYEFDAYQSLMTEGDVVIAVSQSGETADTIDALEIAERKKLRIASVVNMPGSTISRLSEFCFFNCAGPEICVISTKSSSAQMAFGYTLAMYLAGRYKEGLQRLKKLDKHLKNYLGDQLMDEIAAAVQKINGSSHIFLLGRGRNFHIAAVGAHNIKEASYKHAEGFAAGELKHGALALIEKGTPVISFIDRDDDYRFMLGATAEAKCRGASVIGLSFEDNELFDQFIKLPSALEQQAGIVANNIPCQLLAYQLSVAAGINPDRPRNLAKSVTVR